METRVTMVVSSVSQIMIPVDANIPYILPSSERIIFLLPQGG